MRKISIPSNNKIKASNMKVQIQDDIIKEYTKIKEERKFKSMHLSFKAKEINIQNTNNIYPIKTVTKLNNTQNATKILVDKLKSLEIKNSVRSLNIDMSKISKNVSTPLGSSLRANEQIQIKNIKNVLNNKAEYFNTDPIDSNEINAYLPKIENMISEFTKKLEIMQQEKNELENKLKQTGEEYNNFKKESETNKSLVEKERDEYKDNVNKYMEISRQLAEEVIILRNQLDKFLHFKK